MKKILTLLLALCLVMGLMAGCSSSSSSSCSGSSGTTDTSEASEAEEPAEEEPEAEEPAAEAEEPAGEEAGEPAEEGGTAASGEVTAYAQKIFGEGASPAEVTYPVDTTDTLELVATFPDALLASYPNGLADLSIYKAAEEITGIHLDYNSLSTSASNEQFNVMIASGDYPDLIGWGLNYANGDDAAVDEEIYLDLTEYIAEYAPNYYALLSTDDELLRSAVSSSGYITAFFGLTTEDRLASAGLVIRTDVLDELGLDKPYTIDEYDEVLAAFKDYGMEQPFVMLAPGAIQDNWLAAAYDVAAFTNNFPQSVAPTYVQDGEIKFGPMEAGFKEYLTKMHEWYEKGYINSDFISKNSNWNGPDYSNIITTGNAGIFYADEGNISGYIEVAEIEGFDLEATYDMHATSDSVNHFAQFSKKSASNGFRITTNCENIELACQWGDWWYSDEGSLLANYGIEGEGFEYVDGVPTFTELVTESELGMRDALLVYASNGTICCVIDGGAAESAYSAVDQAAPEIWATGMDDDYVIPSGVSLTADENTEASNIYYDIKTTCIE